MSNLEVLENALEEVRPSSEENKAKTSQPHCSSSCGNDEKDSLHNIDNEEGETYFMYEVEREENKQVERLSFTFNAVEIKSKIKKTKKHLLQNTWDLPMANFSRDELVIYMIMFHKKIEGLQRINKLEIGFAEMICCALHNYWNDHKLVGMALTNILSVTQIASNEVKRSLLDTKIILAAVITVSLQRDYLKYTSEVDETIENVLLILYYGIEKDLGKLPQLDNRVIEVIMMLVPYMVSHLKRRDSTEEFFWLLRHLLIFIFNKYDIASRKIIKDLLSKHGIVSCVLEFVMKYQLSNVQKMDPSFMRVIDIAFLLRGEAKLNEFYQIVPNLLNFLKLDGHPLITQILVDYSQTAHVVVRIFHFLVQDLTLEGAKFLMDNLFLNNMIKALVNNRYYQQRKKEIADILYQSMAKIDFIIMDGSQSQKDKKTCFSMLLKICEQLGAFINPSCDLKITCSYLFYLAATLLSQYTPIPKDTILLMVKALTVVCDINHVRKVEIDKDRTIFGSNKRIEHFLKHFMKVIDHEPHNINEDERLKLKNIVNDDLPEVISEFVGMQSDIHILFAEALTRLVLLFYDFIGDFFSTRWQNVHYLMLSYYLHTCTETSQEPMIHQTKLLFMWKLLTMDKGKAIVCSILQLEVDFRECTDKLLVGEIIERCKATIKSNTVQISAAEDYLSKLYCYLTSDIKSVLMDPTYITPRHNMGSFICALREVTYVMFKIAQNCASKAHIKLLKSLVFWALDLVRDQNDSEIKNNVDNFIIHLYLERE